MTGGKRRRTHQISFLPNFANLLRVGQIRSIIRLPRLDLEILVERVGKREIMKDRPEESLAKSFVEI